MAAFESKAILARPVAFFSVLENIFQGVFGNSCSLQCRKRSVEKQELSRASAYKESNQSMPVLDGRFWMVHRAYQIEKHAWRKLKKHSSARIRRMVAEGGPNTFCVWGQIFDTTAIDEIRSARSDVWWLWHIIFPEPFTSVLLKIPGSGKAIGFRALHFESSFRSTKSCPSITRCHEIAWSKLTHPGIVQCFRQCHFQFTDPLVQQSQRSSGTIAWNLETLLILSWMTWRLM